MNDGYLSFLTELTQHCSNSDPGEEPPRVEPVVGAFGKVQDPRKPIVISLRVFATCIQRRKKRRKSHPNMTVYYPLKSYPNTLKV